MTNAYLSFSLVCFYVIQACAAASSPFYGNPKVNYKQRMDKLDFESSAFNKPDYESFSLKNGVQVYYTKDEASPLLRVSAYYKMGWMYETEAEKGSSSLISSLLAEGGTDSYTSDQINDFKDETASIYSTAVYDEVTILYMNLFYNPESPAEEDKALKGLNIFLSMLTEPVFEENELFRKKIEVIKALKKNEDDPSRILWRELLPLLYGKAHPMSSQLRPELLNSFTPKQLQDIYKSKLDPGNTVLGVSGNISKEKLTELLEMSFGNWTLEAKKELPIIFEPAPITGTRVFYYQKEVSQTTFIIALLGVRYSSKEEAALWVTNSIYFGHILYDLRVKNGLSYYVLANYRSYKDVNGYIYTLVKTRSDVTVEAIKLVLKNMEEMIHYYASEDVILRTKQYYNESFNSLYEDLFQFISGKALLKILGLSESWSDEFKKAVNRVDRKAIYKIAKKYFNPKKAVILVIGNEKDFDKPLKRLRFGDPVILHQPDYIQKKAN